MIDLRSDTVTKPTPEMRKVMAQAEVGDDVWGDDPSVKALEEKTAEILGMEGKLGEVSTGAYADLLVLEGNPLENIGTLKENSFEMIIQNGKVIKNMITHERNLT